MIAPRLRIVAAAAAVVLSGACVSAPLPPAPTSNGAGGWPARIAGIGTEPFWALTIDAATVRFTTPEDPDGRSGTIVRSAQGGRLVLTGRLAGEPLRAELDRAPCSDGMSDRVWPFALQVEIGARRLSGCAAPEA